MRARIIGLGLILICSASNGFAESAAKHKKQMENATTNAVPTNYYSIAFYKPNYLLPFYYTASPYQSIYQNNIPGNQRLNHGELKFQFSVKLPLIKNINNYRSTFYIAYTQLSYWQFYNHDPFFRESDYEPEIFLANELEKPFIGDWKFNFFNLGVVHQSNGYGGKLERSWDRFYVEAIMGNQNWLLSLKPWYVISDKSAGRNYLAHYLGYGQITLVYKWQQLVLSIGTHSLIEHGGKYATGEFTLSFPLTHNIKGFAQVFSGYGQSLIEYNHRTNAVGIGFALSDWV